MWFTLIAIGQLYHRLVRPYQRLPLQLASLLDDSKPIDDRKQLVDEMMRLSPCCVDALFGLPVLKCFQQEGGAAALDGGAIVGDLETALRVKVSNLEIELNFARASTSRNAMQRKTHKVASMVAKHVTAEIKLAQRRKMIAVKKSGKVKHSTDPGSVRTQHVMILI